MSRSTWVRIENTNKPICQPQLGIAINLTRTKIRKIVLCKKDRVPSPSIRHETNEFDSIRFGRKYKSAMHNSRLIHAAPSNFRWLLSWVSRRARRTLYGVKKRLGSGPAEPAWHHLGLLSAAAMDPTRGNWNAAALTNAVCSGACSTSTWTIRLLGVFLFRRNKGPEGQ